MTDKQLIKLLRAQGGKVIATDVPFSVDHVHDGDTVDVVVRGWGPFSNILWRLYGWDAPELHDMRGPIRILAQRAKDAMIALLSAPGRYFKTVRKDKFFRVDCEASVGGVDVGQALAADELVRAYSGEGPKPW